MNFLIADDSTFMRSLLKNVLTENGHKIIGEAENGKIAVEKYKELAPDIVTLDITMNVMNGLEALKKIREYDINANVIMVSSMGQEGIIKEALQSGAKGYLIKPFSRDLVLSTLQCIPMSSVKNFQKNLSV